MPGELAAGKEPRSPNGILPDGKNYTVLRQNQSRCVLLNSFRDRRSLRGRFDFVRRFEIDATVVFRGVRIQKRSMLRANGTAYWRQSNSRLESGKKAGG